MTIVLPNRMDNTGFQTDRGTATRQIQFQQCAHRQKAETAAPVSRSYKTQQSCSQLNTLTLQTYDFNTKRGTF